MTTDNAYQRASELFVVRQKACFKLDEIDETTLDDELRPVFSAFKSTLKETALAMQAFFNMAFAATLDAKFNDLFRKNQLEVYANYLEAGKEGLTEEIRAEAVRLTKNEMDSLPDEVLQTIAAERLLGLSDSWSRLVLAPNYAMLRQSCVMLWSACESLLRECFRLFINLHPSCATEIFSADETKKIWSSRDFSLELIEGAGFDLKNCMGDLLLEINPMINLRAIKAGFSVLSRQNEGVEKALKAQSTYDLFALRNLVAHRNGIVDEKFASESRFLSAVGEKVALSPADFEEMYLAAKSIALSVYEWLSGEGKARGSDKGSA